MNNIKIGVEEIQCCEGENLIEITHDKLRWLYGC
jgi:hypothetical protein